MEMNLQLHHVVSDITGATRNAVIRAIVAGERNPDVLATYRDVRRHSSIDTVRAALVGNDREEHVFALTQSLELYDTYQAKMLACDRKLEALIAALTEKGATPVGKLSRPRVKTKQVNTPSFDVRAALHGVLGVDLTEDPELGRSLALKLIGECGTDLRAWPTSKHFTSWLCLAPGNKTSGGKVLSSRTRRSSSGQPVVAVSRDKRRAERDGARSILSTAVLSCRQGQGRDSHGPQNCGSVLQYP